MMIKNMENIKSGELKKKNCRNLTKLNLCFFNMKKENQTNGRQMKIKTRNKLTK